MRPALRPRIVRQIFAPVPDARSRCLSSFIAISRQGLPTALRYEPSHVLAGVSLFLLCLGYGMGSLSRLSGPLELCGWGLAVVAIIALVGQDKITYGSGRPRLLRALDEARRTVGLDQALLPESLEFLEGAAQQWERIEHALQARSWDPYGELKLRVHLAAHIAMEDLVVTECGSRDEAGVGDEEAEQLLSTTSVQLRNLADCVDAVSNHLSPEQIPGGVRNGLTLDEDLQLLDQAITMLRTSSN